MQEETDTCAFCVGKNATRLCGACACVAYCGDECARRDWLRHWDDVHSMASAAEQQEEEDHDLDEIPMPPLAASGGKLYLGGIPALNHLDTHHVDAVVTVLPYDKRHISEKQLKHKLGSRAHMRIPWYDHEDQKMPFETLCKAARFIHAHRKQGHNVLVHCAAGWSRSVSVIIFYMTHLSQEGWAGVEEALAHIQHVRPSAGPNKGFIAQLKQYARLPCQVG